MNCQSFQNNLLEYAEGSLAPEARQAAERHLAECSACRQLSGQQQTVAKTLSQGFRQSVEHLTLPRDFQERLQAALRDEAAAKVAPLQEARETAWLRLVWPVAIAACVLFISFRSTQIFPVVRSPGVARVNPAGAVSPPDISVLDSYQVPVYIFHRDGDRVVDAISYQTIVASGTLQPGGPEVFQPQPAGKTPL